MSFDDDSQLDGWDLNTLKDEVIRLRDAIRSHRDEKGHDRCWLDDIELYKSLPEGTFGIDLALPPKEEFIKNCERYHAHRQDPTNPALTFIRQAKKEPLSPDQWLPVPYEPAPGSKWKHFKGGTYSIVYIARDCEDPNHFLIVYRSREHGTIWVRDYTNFTERASNGLPRFESID